MYVSFIQLVFLWVGANLGKSYPTAFQLSFQGNSTGAPNAPLPGIPAITSQSQYQHLQNTNTALAYLDTFFDWNTATYRGSGMWNTAAALDMFIIYSTFAQSSKYLDVMQAVFHRYNFNFNNKYNDDMGWWCITACEGYQVTNDSNYLDTAKQLYKEMSWAWDTNHCNGGIYWLNGNPYKNSITAGLYLVSALKLYETTQDNWYLSESNKILNWFYATGMIRSDYLITDGIDNNCNPNGLGFTYSQGIMIGAFHKFYKLTGNYSQLQMANNIAKVSMQYFSDANGILFDPTDNPTKNPPDADSASFKGIYMRYLFELYQETRDGTIKDFINKQGDVIWNKARDPVTGNIGVSWTQISPASNSVTLMSAITGLLTQAMIQ